MRLKSYVLILSLFTTFLHPGLLAQKAIWAKNLGQNLTEAGDIVADKWSNSYLVSWSPGRLDKFNKLGQQCWTKTISGGSRQLAIDPGGNPIVAGVFSGTIDMDPGNGVANFTAASSNGDIFVEKLDSAGNLQWCKTFGNPSSGSQVYTLAVDHSGNVIFICNTPSGTDFDPGPAIVTNTGIGICKLSNNGDLIKLGSFGFLTPQSMCIDAADNILIAGMYSLNPTDFDPGPGEYKLTPASYQELFACKLDKNFGFQWARPFISPNTNAQSNACRGIGADPSGNVYITGETFDNFDADPGPGVANITVTGAQDMFLIKLTAAGNFIFRYRFGSDRFTNPTGLVVDASGNIFINGVFDGGVDFDAGPAAVILSPAYSYNAFAIKLDPNARLLWAQAMKSNGQIWSSVMDVDNNNQVHLAGTFKNSVNFSGASVNATALDREVYIARFADANNMLGNVYYDANANGIKDGTEFGLGGVMVKAVSGALTYYAITDSLGDYNIIADAGQYTISVAPMPKYYSASIPATQAAPFTAFLVGNVDSLNNFGLVPVVNKNDLETHVTNLTRARPGFNAAYQVDYKNLGTSTLSGTVILKHPVNISYTNAVPPAVSHTDTTDTWNFSGLKPMTTASMVVTYKLAVNTPVSSSLQFISKGVIAADEDTLNNSDTLKQIVTASFDPNDKEVKPAGDILQAYVAAGQWLDYTIRFQNTGTDTAINILLTDTLSSNLDISTLERIATSHKCAMQLRNNIVQWKFNDIHLPDSNTNELLSHGFVRYRVQMKKSLVPNDVVTNTAYIGFDYNEYVPTNQVITRVADSIKTLCPGAAVALVTVNPGAGFNYQWQVDSTGNGFIDLANTGIYSGANKDSLYLAAAPSSNYGFKYRCVATKGATTIYGQTNILKFSIKWTGSVSTAWENPGNWSCNELPDGNTDVVVSSGTAVLNSDAAARSIIVSPGAMLTIATGHMLTVKH